MQEHGARRSRPPPLRAATRLIATVGAVVLVTAVSMPLQHELGFQQTSMLLFAAVIALAAWLGLWCGLLAAVLATLASNAAYRGLHVALGEQDFVNAVIYAVGAWVAGLYIDERRRARDAVLRVARSMRPPELGKGRFAFLVEFLYRPFVVETVRLAAAGWLSVAGAGLGVMVRERVGPLPVSMLYLAAVVLSASLLGARYALISAILSTILYDLLVVAPRYAVSLDTATAGVNIVVFLAVGWRVGLFTDRARYERTVVRSLLDAGRHFSGAAEEAEIQRLLAEAISTANGGRYVAVWDGQKQLVSEVGRRPDDGQALQAPRPWEGPAEQGAWRTRTLVGEAGALCSVAWRIDEGEDQRPVEAIIGVLVDLAAAAMARARLSAERAELQAVAEAEQLRRALLASLSHDVRTPLSGILGSATALLDKSDEFPKAVREDLLANIRDQAYRLDRYLQNLLGMTRLEAGALQAQLRAVPLEPLVFETWESIADAAGMRRPLIEVDPDVEVMADPALLRQAIGNVLENALKFSPKETKVEVRSDFAPGAAVLAIEDHGPGAAVHDLERLFQPFFRSGPYGKPGVGLGLFIARSFVQAMGGEMHAMARKDGAAGMRIEMILPLAQGAHDEKAVNSHRGSRKPTQRLA